MLQLVQASRTRLANSARHSPLPVCAKARRGCGADTSFGIGEGRSPASDSLFSDFAFFGIVQRSLRNESRIGNGGLKGRLQPRLAASHDAARHR